MVVQLVRDVWQNFREMEPNQIEILRNEGRLVAKIEVQEQFYFLKGEQQTLFFMKNLITFVNKMKASGLPFTAFEKTMDGRSFVEASGMLFTLEKNLVGEEVEQLRLIHIQEIGKMLGRQHAVSQTIRMRFNRGTSWGMFGGNETDALGDYDENELSFTQFIEQVDGFTNEIQLINELYIGKREKLKLVWDTLPSGPVQGDFCPYNLLFNAEGTITTIFDFDIAGDEVFLNECIGVGVYLAWHCEYIDGETEWQRYQSFLQAYESEREFSSLERESMDDLLAIVRAFRYDRIEEGISTLNGEDGGKQFVVKTLEILQLND
ncbi:phosphotransferase enzyme family protein [Sporosarcina sp. YIM B06819]|uniref:phosphotransferase enzyme family protein n=1 Tax=Sporosarcina sp. YIM B06819 TaxID=3081769 RepID=UPI00298BD3D3|nr:phosphotransferase [Sporosarcina sp. YIM B06819]